LNPEFSIPIYTPRTSFHMILESDELLLNDLTLNFDPFTIQVLKAEFEKRQDGMKKTEFIKIVKDQISHW